MNITDIFVLYRHITIRPLRTGQKKSSYHLWWKPEAGQHDRRSCFRWDDPLRPFSRRHRIFRNIPSDRPTVPCWSLRSGIPKDHRWIKNQRLFLLPAFLRRKSSARHRLRSEWNYRWDDRHQTLDVRSFCPGWDKRSKSDRDPRHHLGTGNRWL